MYNEKLPAEMFIRNRLAIRQYPIYEIGAGNNGDLNIFCRRRPRDSRSQPSYPLVRWNVWGNRDNTDYSENRENREMAQIEIGKIAKIEKIEKIAKKRK